MLDQSRAPFGLFLRDDHQATWERNRTEFGPSPRIKERLWASLKPGTGTLSSDIMTMKIIQIGFHTLVYSSPFVEPHCSLISPQPNPMFSPHLSQSFLNPATTSSVSLQVVYLATNLIAGCPVMLRPNLVKDERAAQVGLNNKLMPSAPQHFFFPPPCDTSTNSSHPATANRDVRRRKATGNPSRGPEAA